MLGTASPSYEGSGELGGFSPSNLRSAYKIPASGGSGQTVAIVDAYDDPNAEADLKTYRSQYGLPACTHANHCFTKINQEDQEEGYYPKPNARWAEEISLDLDMVSAACPECHIWLIEATNNETANLEAAESEAIYLGIFTEISNSWGGEERSTETLEDSVFNDPGVPITFSSGDEGYWVDYPAASKNVIAVGGTSLTKAENERGWQETAWEGAGSGCSAYEPKPSWQSDPDCSKRAVADVATVANPHTPVSVYDTYEEEGWMLFGGTSVGAPLVAGIEAHASKAVREERAETFYRHNFRFDVSKGTNAFRCSGYLCDAAEGYDGPTGWGTPDGTPESWSAFGAVTGQATHISAEGATLTGYVSPPEGAEATYEFEYGKTTSYGMKVPLRAARVGTSATWKMASQSISGLERETTYHYRLVATSGSKSSDGQDHTFVTSPWTVQSTPATEGTQCAGSEFCTKLNQVSCPSAGLCMAVGHLSKSTEFGRGWEKSASLAEQWNGSEWKVLNLPTPSGGGEIFLGDVSCATATACLASGSYLQESSNEWMPLAEHWNGTEWHAEAGPSGALWEVSCASSTFCMAVGPGDSESWNGSTWSAHPLPTPSGAAGGDVENVSCSSSTSCVAVGYTLTPELQYSVLIEHWNGTEWQIQAAPNPSGAVKENLTGVSCSSSTSCTAVGTYSNGAVDEENGLADEYTLAEHWNGSAWKVESTPDPAGSLLVGLENVSCASSTSCTAVGGSQWGDTDVEPYFFAEHWNGTSWAMQPMSTPDGSIDQISGISCPSPRACVATGRAGGGALAERESLPEAVTEEPSIAGVEVTFKGGVNPEESDTHYRFEYGESTAYGTSVPVPEADVGAGAATVKVSNVVTLKAGLYHFRLVASNATGTSYGADQSFTILPTYTSSFASFGSGNDELLEPSDLTTDGSGNVWVADTENDRLEEFNAKGEFVKVVATVAAPYGVAVDSKGDVWTTETGEDRVAEFSSEGKLMKSFGSAGSGNGQFNAPEGLAVSKGGGVYVADRGNKRIEVFSAEGKYLSSLGAGTGKLKSPTGVAFDSHGNLWVTESEAGRVVEFVEGNELEVHSWGESGSGPGQLSFAYRLTVGPEGDIWIAEWGNNRVQVFAPSGEYLYGFGTYGSGEGQFFHARGISIYGTTAYVLDSGEWWRNTGNARVEKWELK